MCVLWWRQLCGRPLWVSGTIAAVRGTGGRSGDDLVKVEVEVVSELDPPLRSNLLGDEVHVVNPVRLDLATHRRTRAPRTVAVMTATCRGSDCDCV